LNSQIDLAWMDRALDLAERGRYGVSPNPMVGAVVVRGRRTVAEAFHRRAGTPHAEALALSRAGRAARGADLYVTLEPCAHHGRTPPCADAIVAAGVGRVIIASRDPNPLVRGRGLARLARAGIEVLWADASRRWRAERQIERFRLWISQRRPFVLAKWAASLDGRIASSSGESRWITGPAARRRALLLREEYDAVLVGAGTILADDPRLTRRLGRNPGRHWRVVLDGRLRIPERARVLRKPSGCVIATAVPATHPRARRLARRGAEIWSLPGSRPGHVDLKRLLAELGGRDVTGLMVEGGGETLAAFFAEGLVDAVAAFVAPRLLGGRASPGAVGGRGFRLQDMPQLDAMEIELAGRDLLITGRLRRSRARRAAAR
jgi:diaminohydroxyphosphoribosylaminopyrimidine deaminase/5-amino-6-(5-phosphoribosylamino)uracil reductase